VLCTGGSGLTRYDTDNDADGREPASAGD